MEFPARLLGTGETQRLRNMLITIAGIFPHLELMTPIEKPREGIIDMAASGPGTRMAPGYYHLILTLEPESSVSNLSFDHALER